jgi:hypothetical protein
MSLFSRFFSHSTAERNALTASAACSGAGFLLKNEADSQGVTDFHIGVGVQEEARTGGAAGTGITLPEAEKHKARRVRGQDLPFGGPKT